VAAPPIKQYSKISLASSVGGMLSISLSIDKLYFDKTNKISFLDLILRLSISIISGIIMFSLIESKIVFSNFTNSDVELESQICISSYFFCILAGFSEKFVPKFLSQFELKTNNINTIQNSNDISGPSSGTS
jgi:hypothetical protein